MSTPLSIWEEAVALCADLEDKLLELGMIEAILSSEVHGAAKAESMETSRDLHTSVPRVSGVWTLTPTWPWWDGESGSFSTMEWSQHYDNDSEANSLDGSNVDRMLEKSVKAWTLQKYSRSWDKWAYFATYHKVEVMLPDMGALEIFLADLAELSGSLRFSKILRGIKNYYSKPVRPKKPLTRDNIIRFMDLARVGNLMDWRASFPMALCYQQLLRGAECFDMNGSNVVRGMNTFQVVVETLKNHPEGLEFSVPIDRERPSCVGRFMEDYIAKMGIRLGDPQSFFACKVAKTLGVWSSIPSVQVVASTMRAACKRLIKASGLDPGEYATHSCKRGAALEALKAGLTGPQIQDLGRWSSASMVARYSSGDTGLRSAMTDTFRP
jgi:integrase